MCVCVCVALNANGGGHNNSSLQSSCFESELQVTIKNTKNHNLALFKKFFHTSSHQELIFFANGSVLFFHISVGAICLSLCRIAQQPH